MLTAEGVDQELIDNIKTRSRLSRDWRRARKNGESKKIQKACKERYEQQKNLTAIMTGKKKGVWEKRKIEEIKNDGKKFWTMIKELLGKNKEREEVTYVYTQEGD